jgi:hypothetical protein
LQTEEIEKLFRELKRSFEVGTIDEGELQAETKNLFFQDGEGNYWTLGARTEKWYRFDDGDWAQASPPPTLEPVRQEVRPPGMEQKPLPLGRKRDYDTRVVLGLASLSLFFCLIVVALISYQLGRRSVMTSPAEHTPAGPVEMIQMPATETTLPSEVGTATPSRTQLRGTSTPPPTTTQEGNSPTPTPTPTPATTPRPTLAPQPAATAMPTPEMRYGAPILKSPEDGAIRGPGYDAVLEWKRAGELIEGEYYHVEACWNGCTSFWGDYVRDTTWTFPWFLRGDALDDRYYWHVTVRVQRGDAPAGPFDPAISPQSETWIFLFPKE